MEDGRGVAAGGSRVKVRGCNATSGPSPPCHEDDSPFTGCRMKTHFFGDPVEVLRKKIRLCAQRNGNTEIPEIPQGRETGGSKALALAEYSSAVGLSFTQRL